MHSSIDKFLSLGKWPAAIFAVLLLPGAVLGLFETITQILAHPVKHSPFFGGAIGYYLGWKWFFRRRAWGSMISTFEHELTHALFALFTFRIPRSIRVTWDQGGHMTHTGRSNWLILIAPYWFPTATFATFTVMLFLPESTIQTASIFLGITVSYHLTSSWIETHPEQSDLRRAGFGFCWCVLPFLNVWAYGMILAFLGGGGPAAAEFSAEVFGRSLSLAQAMVS
jgi:hypothetical protein